MPNYTVEQLQEYGPEPLMRWLIPIVRRGGTITYGRVAERLASELRISGKIFPIQIGHVAGSLENRLLEVNPDIPLLNALVVNTTGTPGSGIEGYLRARYGGWRSLAQRRELCARAARAVYEYEHWDDVYEELFDKDAPDDTELQTREKDGKSYDGRIGGEPEGPEHRKLKLYIRDHPASIGLPQTAEGKEELKLLSGDEIDVRFIDAKKITVVEVKSIISGYNDFRRGIYQCVKYRAVMNAQLDTVRGRDGVAAVLVTELPLPGDLAALAKRLKISAKCVRVN